MGMINCESYGNHHSFWGLDLWEKHVKLEKGGTENGPAILPIANSFEIFYLVSSGISATLFKFFEVIGDLGPE
jgi:hypothetical protein